jgi:hypothetical protein
MQKLSNLNLAFDILISKKDVEIDGNYIYILDEVYPKRWIIQSYDDVLYINCVDIFHSVLKTLLKKLQDSNIPFIFAPTPFYKKWFLYEEHKKDIIKYNIWLFIHYNFLPNGKLNFVKLEDSLFRIIDILDMSEYFYQLKTSDWSRDTCYFDLSTLSKSLDRSPYSSVGFIGANNKSKTLKLKDEVVQSLIVLPVKFERQSKLNDLLSGLFDNDL